MLPLYLFRMPIALHQRLNKYNNNLTQTINFLAHVLYCLIKEYFLETVANNKYKKLAKLPTTKAVSTLSEQTNLFSYSLLRKH